MCVSCECCVLYGRGLCDRLITHPEESYRLWHVIMCGLETSVMRWPWPMLGCCTRGKKNIKELFCLHPQFRTLHYVLNGEFTFHVKLTRILKFVVFRARYIACCLYVTYCLTDVL
jgi:hypothetical protein